MMRITFNDPHEQPHHHYVVIIVVVIIIIVAVGDAGAAVLDAGLLLRQPRRNEPPLLRLYTQLQAGATLQAYTSQFGVYVFGEKHDPTGICRPEGRVEGRWSMALQEQEDHAQVAQGLGRSRCRGRRPCARAGGRNRRAIACAGPLVLFWCFVFWCHFVLFLAVALSKSSSDLAKATAQHFERSAGVVEHPCTVAG